MYKIILTLSVIFLISSCAGTNEENLKKLDQRYGYCDNPHRNFTKLEYKICKDKERAAGPDGKGFEQEAFDLQGALLNFGRKNNPTIVNSSNVNPSLWQAALEVTSQYNLKIADNDGGILQTEWIYEQPNLNDRCLIKIQILTLELVSNGVKTNFICEKKDNEIWTSVPQQELINQEKQLTLKILELAQVNASLL